MDGVLIDNMRYHRQAWELFFLKHRPSLPFEDFIEHFGKTNEDLLQILCGENIPPAVMDGYASEKEALYREVYAPAIAPLPGLIEFLERLKAAKIPTAVATAAPRVNVDFTFRILPIRSFFDVVVDAGDIIKGKPDPEIYLETASRLGVDPSGCVVFEDSPTGIRAARSAGMTVVGVATSHPADSLEGCAFVIRDFRNFDESKLAGQAKKK